MLTVPAYAKINLTLEVLGYLSDGYHEISSVMQTITLYDTLSFQPSEHIHLVCNLPELTSADNLVVRAARLLQQMAGSNYGAFITLDKGIPHSCGLGGGSSDAAATLKALNELWGLGFPTSSLVMLAPHLGSDCAFFIHGGTALVEGKGEKVIPLPSPPKSWIVLLVPPFVLDNKTQRLYARLNESHFTSGELSSRIAHCLRQGREINPCLFYNVFEQVAFTLFPGLGEYRQQLVDAGAASVHLSGSGPCLFTLTKDKPQGERIYQQLKSEGAQVYLAQTR
jgi:4-diphosphocytidyl-2-C-methyl-D-erythritol kinase